MFLDQRARRVPGGLESLVVARVVDQRGLDPLRRRHCKRTRHDSCRDPGHQVAQRREGAGLGIFEGQLDAVERNEPDRVLGDRAYHERLTSLVERSEPFFLNHRFDYPEGVACGTVFVQLHACFGEFEC